MSLLTALSLSFNNLWTKKVRTLLIAFAGSIGIIGIAMILSMSNGVDRYIQNVEQDTLKSYPLQITDSSFNLANFMPQIPARRRRTRSPGGKGREWNTVTNLFSRVSTNDLRALQAYLDSGESDIDQVQAIDYDYNVSPRRFMRSRDGQGAPGQSGQELCRPWFFRNGQHGRHALPLSAARIPSTPCPGRNPSTGTSMTSRPATGPRPGTSASWCSPPGAGSRI